MAHEQTGRASRVTAELIGGPFDGLSDLELSSDQRVWPQYIDMPLTDATDPRRVRYRLEPLANGTIQYVFHARYNLAPG